jgi:CubicO group peptidase (beta-lactamase class C family)
MSLQHLVDLFWADMPVVVERVKALREGLLAVGAEVALLAARHLAMFMSLTVTTELAFHRSNRGRISSDAISPQKSDARPDVLAWLIKRLCNQSLAEVMQERIWSKLGVERDAFWLVGPVAVETAESGLITTLRDMARFGQMLLQKRQFNGQQIVPHAVIEAIEQGGDPDAFARGPAASPMSEGYSYHHQWWMAPRTDGAYYALGYARQHLYI